jgi:hypothetical protein
MPYQQFDDGLYLLKQYSHAKGVDHYGIMDVGNLLRLQDVDGSHPVIIHQTPPSITVHWLQDTGNWNMLGKIEDETSALQRIKKALENPRYDLFGHNCEHFARYVATGNHESTQLQFLGVIVGLTALAIVASR